MVINKSLHKITKLYEITRHVWIDLKVKSWTCYVRHMRTQDTQMQSA